MDEGCLELKGGKKHPTKVTFLNVTVLRAPRLACWRSGRCTARVTSRLPEVRRGDFQRGCYVPGVRVVPGTEEIKTVPTVMHIAIVVPTAGAGGGKYLRCEVLARGSRPKLHHREVYG